MVTPGRLLPNFYNYAYDKITQRMRDLNLSTEMVNRERVANLFARYSDSDLSSEKLQNDLEDTMTRNMVVPDGILCQRLNLEVYDIKESNPTFHCWFYVRSWKISSNALDQIIEEFTDDGTYDSVIQSWLAQISGCDMKYYYLRYVGFCKSQTNDPQNRYYEDIDKRRNGFLHNFFKKLTNIDQNEYEHEILVFKKDAVFARQNALEIGVSSTVDPQEQLLIALFGLGQLLNSQPGGYNAKYDPGVQQKKAYCDLHVDFFKKFKTDFKSYQNNNGNGLLKANLSNWIDRIKTLQKSFTDPNLRRYSELSYKLKSSYVDTMKKLATPTGTIDSYNLVTMVGHDITVRNFHDGKPYFDSDSSRAGYALCDMLTRLQAWESNANKWNPKDFMKFIGKIPFVDLIPWLENKKMTIQQGISQLSMYLNIVQPIVTITFSREVTSVALSNFVHEDGLDSTRNLLDFVGVPKVVSYANNAYLSDDNMNGPPVGYSTIIIPHYHPGLDKHTTRLVDGPRILMDITWQLTLCILAISIDIIRQSKRIEGITREGIVTSIMETCTHGSERNPAHLRTLYARLNQEKARYIEALNQIREEYPAPVLSEQLTDLRTRSAETRVQALPPSEGEKGSDARRSQANKLWKMNYNMLHIAYPRDNKDAWLDWAINRVNTKKNYYMSSLRARQDIIGSQIPGLTQGQVTTLQNYRPDGVEEGDFRWQLNLDARKSAWKRWSADTKLKAGPNTESYSSQRQRERGIASSAARVARAYGSFDSQIHNKEITLSTSGRQILLWLNEETREQIKFIITLSTKKMNPEDRKRKILVTSTGFNLVATSTRSTAPDILLTKEFLESLYQGQDLFRMWQIEFHTKNGEEVPRRTLTVPQKAGKLFPTYDALKKIADAEGANAKVVLDVNDIEEGDSLHILHEYVRQLPENRHIISMVPSETAVRDSYLAKKSRDDHVDEEQIIFFQQEFRLFVLANFNNHPRKGECLYKLENIDVPNLRYGKLFLWMIQGLTSRESIILFYKFSKGIHQELKFILPEESDL